MAIRKIITQGDDVLNKKCREITAFDAKLHKLLDDMKETMISANGVGLAAPQIGILRRVAVVLLIETDEVVEFVNPVIIKTEGEFEDPEGCLSVPGVFGMVKRPFKTTVKAQDRNGNFFEITGEELASRAFCHEIDHLDGKLFVDLVTRYLDDDEVN